MEAFDLRAVSSIAPRTDLALGVLIMFFAALVAHGALIFKLFPHRPRAALAMLLAFLMGIVRFGRPWLFVRPGSTWPAFSTLRHTSWSAMWRLEAYPVNMLREGGLHRARRLCLLASHSHGGSPLRHADADQPSLRMDSRIVVQQVPGARRSVQ